MSECLVLGWAAKGLAVITPRTAQPRVQTPVASKTAPVAFSGKQRSNTIQDTCERHPGRSELPQPL